MDYKNIVENIATVNTAAQLVASKQLNQVMTLRNWLIGAYIFEYEQNGEDRITYGSHLIKNLADDLKKRGATGFSFSNLKSFRQFALAYVNIANNTKLANLQLLLGINSQMEQISQMSGQFISLTFPTLEERAANIQTLAWQDANYYE